MITKEAIEAACAALNKRDRGNAISIPDVVAMLTAAFAAMPGPAVKVKPLAWVNAVIGDGSPFRQQTWTADRYQIVESPSGKFDLRHGAYAICDTLDAAKAAAQADYEARIMAAIEPAPDLAAENERLREALERQGDNMAFVINHATLPRPWLKKFMAELAEDRAALERT